MTSRTRSKARKHCVKAKTGSERCPMTLKSRYTTGLKSWSSEMTKSSSSPNSFGSYRIAYLRSRTMSDDILLRVHDSAGQLIAALGMNLAGIAPRAKRDPSLAKALEDAQNLVQQLNREIRTTSYLLHPPLLDENGVSQAIQWYIQGLTERSGLKITLDIPDDFGRLSADLEMAVFRVVQECLTNIHRHSCSKTATIRLSRSSESVALEIRDNGNGIPAEKLDGVRAHRSGVGITGIRERVRHLKGAMDIRSNGTGTNVCIMLPVSMTDISEPKNMLEGSGIAG